MRWMARLLNSWTTVWRPQWHDEETDSIQCWDNLILALDVRDYGSVSFMMTSSKGNIFRVTDHLWGESTGHRWIPLTEASDAELWCFLWSAPEQMGNQTIEPPVIKTQSRSLWRHCNGFNALRYSDTIWCQITRSSMCQVVTCRLFVTRPLPEPMMPYCPLDPYEAISVKFDSKYIYFNKVHSEMFSAKCRSFCSGLNTLTRLSQGQTTTVTQDINFKGTDFL